MRELNPNHPVTREFHEQWHKLCAVLMVKFGLEKIEITCADLNRMACRPGGTNITMRAHGDTVTLTLVSDCEAERLARQEGGLPV